MNFQQLEYILAIKEEQHFGRAADRCHVTQATLSAMVKKLEQELGVQLFDRSKQPILSTEDGEEVLQLAQEAIRIRDKMKSTAHRDDRKLSGPLSLGVIPTVANSLLPIILGPLLKSHPELELSVKEITTEEIKMQLRSGRLDLGILSTPLDEADLEEEILYYESMMVYGIKEKEKKYVLPTDLSSSDIWLLEEGHCFKNQSMTICDIKQKSNQPKNLQFNGSSFETLLNMTDNFGGYTLIPELYFRSLSAARRKKVRGFERPIPVREISLISYRSSLRSRTIEVLSDLIRKKVASSLATTSMPARDLSIIGI